MGYFLVLGSERITRDSPGKVLLKHAVSNMRVFVKDVRDRHGTRLKFERDGREHDGEGLYGFWIVRSGRCPTCGREYTDRARVHPRRISVMMPGLSLERVRYMGEPQNIWDFPRMCVDGNTWAWHFAINVAGELGCR